MEFSVLTPDFRLQLEQQCDRLSSERDAIVQAAVEQATATIDTSLAHINALLGNTPQATPDVKPSIKGKQKKLKLTRSIFQSIVPRKSAKNQLYPKPLMPRLPKRRSNLKLKQLPLMLLP